MIWTRQPPSVHRTPQLQNRSYGSIADAVPSKWCHPSVYHTWLQTEFFDGNNGEERRFPCDKHDRGALLTRQPLHAIIKPTWGHLATGVRALLRAQPTEQIL